MYKPRTLDKDPDAMARRMRAMTRVKKLLRLAEDQVGTPEGRNARQRAEELLERHGMSWSVVSSPDWVGVLDFRHRRFEVGRDEPWRHTLVATIATYLDCVALHHRGATEVETYGPEAALPQVEYVFSVYLRQLRTAWRTYGEALDEEGIWTNLTRAQKFDTRQAYCVSFVLGVKERLEADRRAELERDPTAARDARRQQEELDRWMRQAGVRWRSTANDIQQINPEAYAAGQTAQVSSAMSGRGDGPRRLTDRSGD